MDFPNACCGDAPDLLTQYFVENCANKKWQCRYVYGVYRLDKYQNIFGHAWLEIGHHIIVDITSDQRQFRNGRVFPQDAFMPCFVGESSDFHELFEVEPLQCRTLFGLKSMKENAYFRLNELYEIIISCIEQMCDY